MRKLTITNVALFFSLFIGMAMLPNYASARSSVSIQLPGISIGVNNSYSQRYSQRYYDSRTRSYRYYSPSRSTQSYSYPSSSYSTGRSVYQPSYQSNYYCPTPGYSQYYYDNRGCYQHGNHYHCN